MLLAQSGDEFTDRSGRRRWWDVAIVMAASCLFLWLGLNAVVPPLAMNVGWIAVLTLALWSRWVARVGRSGDRHASGDFFPENL